MGTADFYIDYDIEQQNISAEIKAEVENRLLELASQDTDLVGAAVAVTSPGQAEMPFQYQARVVVYARPENIAGVKKDDTVQGAVKAALSAVERQVREKRKKLGKPWKRDDVMKSTDI